MLGDAAMKLRFLRVPMLVGALLIACSSKDDDDEGCSVGERSCTTHEDCKGFAPTDFSILGPAIDARCFRSECVAEKCKATPIPGPIDDDRKGDCSRATCDDDGRLVHEPDRSDVPPQNSAEPCSRTTCEPGILGGAGPTTGPAPEGSSCFLRGEQGTCQAGRCVTDSLADAAGEDGGDDAGDSGADAASDAPTDAASD